MNTLSRILAIGALGAAALTQGCGCSSNKNNSNTTVEPPPGEIPSVEVAGAAIKGVLGGATVTAFGINNSGEPAGAAVASSVTNALGKYTLKIPRDYVGKPLAFKVSPGPNDTTKITCDLDIGCGSGIEFGNKYTLPSSSKLALETFVPALDTSKIITVSTFSTLAAEQARKALTGNTNSNGVADAIRKANGEISNMFGLSGELSELELLDITDATAIKEAVGNGKSEAVRMAALNAAVISATQSANPGASLEQALTKLIADITARGLASNSSDNSVADLTKILTAASNILQRVKNLNGNAVNLNELITSLANDLGRVRNEPQDVFNRGVVVPATGLNDKAYQFADLVRQLINGGDIIFSTKVKDGTIKTGSDKLQAQWDAANMLSGEDSRALGTSLAMAADAIMQADEAYESNPLLKEFTAADIRVSIKKMETPVLYSVEQMIAGNSVQLLAVRQYAHSSQGSVETTKGQLNLSGNAQNAAVKITIGNTSRLQAGTLMREHKNNQMSTLIEGLTLVLNAQIAQMKQGAITDPVVAEGTLKLDFASFERLQGETQARPVSKGAMGVAFDGTVMNSTGEKFIFALNVAGDTKGVGFDELFQGIDPLDLSITEENFNSLTAAVSFTADLNSQLSAAKIKLMATRQDLSATRTSLDVMFGAHNLRFATLIKRLAEQPFALTVSNQDRLTMSLSQATVGGNIRGKITGPDGKKELATILQAEGSSCVKVTVQDGRFFCLIDAQ